MWPSLASGEDFSRLWGYCPHSWFHLTFLPILSFDLFFLHILLICFSVLLMCIFLVRLQPLLEQSHKATSKWEVWSISDSGGSYLGPDLSELEVSEVVWGPLPLQWGEFSRFQPLEPLSLPSLSPRAGLSKAWSVFHWVVCLCLSFCLLPCERPEPSWAHIPETASTDSAMTHHQQAPSRPGVPWGVVWRGPSVAKL